MLVDAHAHLLPYDYPPDAPTCFPQMEAVDGETARTLVFGAMRFKARDVFFDAERRIEEMDASGVDVEVLSPMPPLLRYDLPPADGLSLARHVNEFSATLAAANPARIKALGMVPMQDPDAATAELKAIQDQGLHGVEIASNVLGKSIGHEQFLPFFQEAERLGLSVFVHAMPSPSERLPMAAMGTYTVGVEGAFAAGSMVSGGTAAACPDLRLSFSHAAGGFPLMLPRAQYFWGGSWNEEPVDLTRAVMHDDGPSPLEAGPPVLVRLDGLRPAGDPVPDRPARLGPAARRVGLPGDAPRGTGRSHPALDGPRPPGLGRHQRGQRLPLAGPRPARLSTLPAPPDGRRRLSTSSAIARPGSGAGRSSRGWPDPVPGPTCLPSGGRNGRRRAPGKPLCAGD